MKAGLAYNTWPLMNGALVPDGLFVMQPWHLNLFENALTRAVQSPHRRVPAVRLGDRTCTGDVAFGAMRRAARRRWSPGR